MCFVLKCESLQRTVRHRSERSGRGRVGVGRARSFLGDMQLMRGMIVSRLSRRALFAATASVAFAVALGSIPAKADDQDSAQAEWPQSYEASPQMTVGREATPILSPATVDATEAAIGKYQDIVAKGGWNQLPAGPQLGIGSKGQRVQALRDRLVVTGDLDPVAGAGSIYDSFVEAAVK